MFSPDNFKNNSEKLYLLWFGIPVLLYQVLISRILSQIFGSLFFIQLFLIAVAYLGTSLGSYYADRWKFTLSRSHLALVGLNLGLLAFYSNDAALLGAPKLSLMLGFTLFFLISFFSSLLLPLFFLSQSKLEQASTQVFNQVYFYFHLLVVGALIWVELDLISSIGITQILIGLTILEAIWSAFWWLQERNHKALQPAKPPITIWTLSTDDKKLLLTLFSFSVISGIIQSILYRQVQTTLAPLAFHYTLYLAALLLSWAASSLWFQTRWGYQWLQWKSFKSKSALLVFSLLVWTQTWPVFWAWALDALQLSTFDGVVLNPAVNSENTPFIIFLIRSVFTLGLIFPFGFFFGSLLPLVKKENEKVSLGIYLSVNSLGNALGILLFISILFEKVGIFQLWALLGLLCLIFATRELKWRMITSALIVTMGGISYGLLKTYSWDLGSFNMRGLKPWHHYSSEISKVQTFKHNSSQVNFVEFAGKYSLMFMNGHTSVFLPHQEPIPLIDTLMGLTPLAYVNNFNESLVIGMGTGATALGSELLFAHTDIVDLDPTMLQVAGSLKFVANRLLNNPKVTFTEADGLTFLRTTKKKYDLIYNNVPSPVYFAAAKLWSREALQAVSDALHDDGIFAQWLDGEISPVALDSLIRSSEDLFSHCDLYLLNIEFYSLVCSKGQAPLHFKGYPESLAPLMQTGPAVFSDFLQALRFPAVPVKAHDPEVPINTLDKPLMDVLVSQNPPGWLHNTRKDSVAERFKLKDTVSGPKCSRIRGWIYNRHFVEAPGDCAELF
ncbi:hypothetical protein ACLVWU_07750 [Bdellovibrio sp. HCB290]|uniref:spermine/spermidine synthase domain-containing protein n=1 Tax=Bdellovibrio sp. HCB290 TaxID=3394356 RepID=UPI0039B42834